MSEKKNKLVVIGSSNIDHIITLPNFPKPGETKHGDGYHIAFGGKGANQAVAAAKLGSETTFVSCLGGDALGEQLRQSLCDAGIGDQYITSITDSLTGVALIWVATTGENMIALNTGANAHLTANYISSHQTAIDHADIVLMQLETPLSGITKACQLAKQKHKWIVLNPAPAKPLPDQLLQDIDLITPNETEAEILTGISINDEFSAHQAAKQLHDKGVKAVLITMGAKGVFYAQNNGHTQYHPAFKVKAVDTTAAGDTFNGALVAALGRDNNMDNAIRYAQAAAALSVQKLGAQPSIPDHKAVQTFLKDHD